MKILNAAILLFTVFGSSAYATPKATVCYETVKTYAIADLQAKSLTIELVQMFNASSVSSEIYEVTGSLDYLQSYRYFVTAVYAVDSLDKEGCEVQSFSVVK
jgi:hypothetical protein